MLRPIPDMALEDYREDIPSSVLQDINRLKGYEEEIKRLQNQLEVAKREHQHLERLLKPYRKDYVESNNHQDIIHCLPDEIFYMILEKALFPQHWRIRTPLLVCKRWYNLIMNNPRLWARIVIPSGFDLFNRTAKPSLVPYIDACYRNSKQTPMALWLTLDDFPTSREYVQMELYDSLNQVAHNVQDCYFTNDYVRISDSIDIMEGYDDYRPYTTQLAEIMTPLTGVQGVKLERWESLRISLTNSRNSEGLISEFVWNKLKSTASHLKGFHANGGTWWKPDEWPLDDIPIFSSASSFTITEVACPSSFGLSPSKLQHLDLIVADDYNNIFEISQFSALRTLCLNMESFGASESISSTFTIHLPHLRSLEIMGYRNSSAKDITFDLPSLYSLSVTSYYGLVTLPRMSPSQVTWENLGNIEESNIDPSIHALSVVSHAASILYLKNQATIPNKFLDQIANYRARGEFRSLKRVYRRYVSVELLQDVSLICGISTEENGL